MPLKITQNGTKLTLKQDKKSQTDKIVLCCTKNRGVIKIM